MRTKIIKYLLLISFIGLISRAFYLKGYYDNEINSLSINIPGDYIAVKHLDDHNSEAARQTLLILLCGKNDTYQRLSKIIFLYKPETSNPKLADLLRKINVYAEEQKSKLWPNK